MLDERARELVEHDQLAAPRRDGEAVVAEHAVELVGVQAGGVDEVARAQRRRRAREPEAAVRRAVDADVTGVERRRSQPRSTASVANASGVVNGQTIPSPGTSSAPRAPGPRCGSRR